MTDTPAEIVADHLAVTLMMDGHGTDAHSSTLGNLAIAALLSHAVPDRAGTRRIVIEQTEGGEAVLLGLDDINAAPFYRLSPLPEKDPTDGR